MRMVVAVIALLLSAQASRANMAPPEPFTLGIEAAMAQEGLRVTAVKPNSKAAEAGLQIGDIILAARGRYVKSMTSAELKEMVEGYHRWTTELVILRNGRDVLVLHVTA